MTASINVDPELLAVAAARADAESQAVFASHSAADAAVDSALTGWVGSSRTALAATAGRWAETTSGLSVGVYQHGEAMRISGLTFAEMAAAHAGRLAGAGPP